MKRFINKSCIFYFACCITFMISTSACRSHKNIISTDSDKTSLFYKKIQTKYAGILNVEGNKIDNLRLYSFIDEWYGVAYKYGGKNKSGIDCSNFVCTLYSSVYSKSIIGTTSSIFNQCTIISKNNLQEGDLVFFKIEGNTISHMGVYLQNNKFVHASTKKGIMIDDLNEEYYIKYYFKGGRIK